MIISLLQLFIKVNLILQKKIKKKGKLFNDECIVTMIELSKMMLEN